MGSVKTEKWRGVLKAWRLVFSRFGNSTDHHDIGAMTKEVETQSVWAASGPLEGRKQTTVLTSARRVKKA